jgi:hypothetical protein
VLAYNLKRVMQILGIGQMLRVLRARALFTFKSAVSA